MIVLNETIQNQSALSGIQIKPRSLPRDTASVRAFTVSFMKMLFTWDFTVSGVIPSFFAIPLFERPRLIQISVMRSRSLNMPLDANFDGAAEFKVSRSRHLSNRLPIYGNSSRD